jgi:putative MATE family efflux protein
MTAAANHAKLTEGPVHRHLVDMALPMMLGILSAVAFNAADTYFVGQLGTGSLAAISFTFPVVFLVINLSVGLGAGISSVLARTIGAGDGTGARRLASASLLFAVLFSALLSLLGMVTIEPLFTAMGAEHELLPDIRAYMVIWYPGLGFIILSMSAIAILRSIGETRLPGYLMVLASFLNIVMDPILIFGWFGAPRLEIAGAAIATVASRGLLVAVLFHLLWRRDLVEWRWPGAADLIDSWRRILHVGLPASGTNVIIPLTMGAIVALVATFGSDAVAGFGVATRIEGVTLVIYYALSAVIGPVVGQNLGAGKVERVHQAVAISVRFCFLSGVVTALILALFGGAIAGLFSDEARVTAVAQNYLWVTPISYGGAGAVMVCCAAFNGLGLPGRAVVVSVLRMLALTLPLAYLSAPFLGLFGVFAAGSLANLIAGVVAYRWIRLTNLGPEGAPPG